MKLKVLPVLMLMYIALITHQSFGQNGIDEDIPDDWYCLDYKADNYRGISVVKAYNELLKEKKTTSVIVAIIDSGVDIEHEDLKDVIWTNEDEIAGNNIDDDKNGYIDDVHGWNFIGNPNGENVKYDTYELTRLYAKYYKKYNGKKAGEIPKNEKKEYKNYLT